MPLPQPFLPGLIGGFHPRATCVGSWWAGSNGYTNGYMMAVVGAIQRMYGGRGGIQVEKATTASQSKSSDAWI
jgi:hypothetical protein